MYRWCTPYTAYLCVENSPKSRLIQTPHRSVHSVLQFQGLMVSSSRPVAETCIIDIHFSTNQNKYSIHKQHYQRVRQTQMKIWKYYNGCIYLMSETSMNQSMTTMTTLHTVIMKDAICSDYNTSAQCKRLTYDIHKIILYTTV